MARADYFGCAECDGKGVYDGEYNLRDTVESGCADIKVLCEECRKSNELVVVGIADILDHQQVDADVVMPVRVWAMPNKNTFSIKPINDWLQKYCADARNIVDPFARDSEVAHVTNDLNPGTKAQFHMEALDFLTLIDSADLVLFDPPYSLRQVKESYNGVGKQFTQKDAQNAIRWTQERNAVAAFQCQGDLVLSFGWSSSCMGKSRGYKIVSMLLVAHGAGHNDTICTAEAKMRADEESKP